MRPTPRSPQRLSRQPLIRAALAITGVLVAVAAAAQPKEDPPTLAWRQSVLYHVPGTADAALQRAAAIPYWRAMHALRRADLTEDRFFMTRALVLHTDLAIVERQTAAKTGDPRATSGSFVLEDGQEVGRRVGSPHWAVALKVATIMAGGQDATAQAVALRWFHTVNALYLHWADATLLYADSGLRYFPKDAVLHVYRGAVHQTYADGRVQQFLDRAYRGSGAPQELAPVELARAEADFRRALELDPTLAEARIRLAHVVGDLGRPDEAVALAGDALRAKLPPFFETYASLILGRNHMRAGRIDEARAAFDRAAVLEPTAQAPRIGLSQVALASGRSDTALALLTAFLGPGRDLPTDVEVWSRYYRVHSPEATDQLAALRAEVR